MPKAKIPSKPQTPNKQGKKAISPKSNSDVTQYQWQPGQTGNPNGRPQSRPFKEALEQALRDGNITLKDVTNALLNEALKGNVPAMKEVADRLEGKSIATVEVDNKNPAFNILPIFNDTVTKPETT